MIAQREPDKEEIKVPAHLRPFIDVLGLDGGVDFLLACGGGYSYFSLNPSPQSALAKVIGVENARALGISLGVRRSRGAGSMRIPMGKPFIARIFSAKGMGASAIARRLHVTDVTVRGWLDDSTKRQSTRGPY